MGRQHRAKLTVTIDPKLLRSLSEYAASAKLTRSRAVEDAIRLWDKSRQAFLAKEGYQAMAGEDLRDAEAYAPALADLWED